MFPNASHNSLPGTRGSRHNLDQRTIHKVEVKGPPRRKDLSHILRSFYKYYYSSHKEAKWDKLKVKFLNYLGQHQEEWKTIKEEEPLQYMPNMEHHFKALTSIRLKGLSQFTGWIKPGSYYHGDVAR